MTRDRELAVVDLATNKVIDRIPLPQAPRTVTYTPDGRSVYVTLFGPNDVPVENMHFTGNTVVRVATSGSHQRKTWHVGQNLYGAAVTPDGRRVFIASHDTNNVFILDAASGATSRMDADANPHAVTFLADGSKGFIANHAGNKITVFDPRDLRTITKIDLGARTSPHGLAISPNGDQLYVAEYDGNAVAVINTDGNVLNTEIPVGRNPQAVAFAPDGRHAYVVNNKDDSVSVINTSSKKVTRKLRVGNSPVAIAVRPDGRYAYVSSLRTHYLYAIRLI